MNRLSPRAQLRGGRVSVSFTFGLSICLHLGLATHPAAAIDEGPRDGHISPEERGLRSVQPVPHPVSSIEPNEAPRPHVVFILADDLGWKDVGYHSSEIRTPAIDRLSASGVRLERFYAMPVCSPTRACLMTGRYPMRLGLQSGVVRPWSHHGLPLGERTVAQALKEVDYRTAIVGKWHLGHFDASYLPTRRGFDHQYGHYNGAIDYFTHMRDGGLDWHREDAGLREEGYSTQLIGREAVRLIEGHDPSLPLFLYVAFNAPHAPLQAPQEYLDRYAHIQDPKRRAYAAMVTCLDDTLGSIVEALERRGMREKTLIAFSSDNGGPPNLGADNGPLRAGKGTLYEGGVRVCAWASWPGRLKAGTVVEEPVHMVDWYPTLLKLAGAKLDQRLPIDGKDIWPVLAEGKPSPHEEILHNVEPGAGAIRRGDWKLIVRGTLPRAMEDPGAFGRPGDAKSVEQKPVDEKVPDDRSSKDRPVDAGGAGKTAAREKPARKVPSNSVELFNVKDDPYEQADLAETHQEIVRALLGRLNAYAREAVPPRGGRLEDRPPEHFKAPAVWGE